MALVIGFEANWRRLQRAIELGWDDSNPADVAFCLPDEAKRGDRILYYVGGKFRYFFGHGRVETDRRKAQSGPWSGISYWRTTPIRLIATPVPGDDVTAATGFAAPTRESVVPAQFEQAV
jgi:hypothetical protein